MRMVNADGCEGERCGNGERCVGKYIYDRGIVRKKCIAVETGRGVLRLEFDLSGEEVAGVTVDMGAPTLKAELIPTKLIGEPPTDQSITVADRQFHVTCVSTSNPHALIFRDSLDEGPNGTDSARHFGPLIERHPAFPNRTNAHFV